MFNSVDRNNQRKTPAETFLDTHGIEWDITVPDTSLDALPKVGSHARVFTYMQHTDAAMTLFGFASEKDRALFFDLLKVDGVGPKSAVKIMSSISLETLVSALDSGDLPSLEKIPGLGKDCPKMLLQLKGKLTLDDDLPGNPRGKIEQKSEFADIISALANMGYDKRDAAEVINRLSQELSSAPEVSGQKHFTKMLPSEKEDLLFRRAIVELAQ